MTNDWYGFVYNGNWVSLVYPNSQAAKAQIKEGWYIKSINGKNVSNYHAEVKQAITESRTLDNAVIVFSDQPYEKEVVFQPGSMGLVFSDNIITNVQPKSQAEKLGIRPGWTINKVNGNRQTNDHDAINNAIDETYQIKRPTTIIFGCMKREENISPRSLSSSSPSSANTPRTRRHRNHSSSLNVFQNRRPRSMSHDSASMYSPPHHRQRKRSTSLSMFQNRRPNFRKNSKGQDSEGS